MIVLYPDPVLRKKSRRVVRLNEEVRKTISLLKRGLTDSEIGIALSAPQVGRSWQVFAVKHDHHHCQEKGDHDVDIYFNPRIVDDLGQEKTYPRIIKDDHQEEDFLEGCLSFPGLYGTVKRWLKIKVRYQTIGKDNQLIDKEETLSGLMAIIFQHETDHLKGILFIDHIRRDKGKLYRDEGKGGLKRVSLDSL